MLAHARVLFFFVFAGSVTAARIKQSPSELVKTHSDNRGVKAHNKQQPADSEKQSTDGASVAKAAEVAALTEVAALNKVVPEKRSNATASLLHATASEKHEEKAAPVSAPEAASKGSAALVQGKTITKHAVASTPQSVPEGELPKTTSEPAKGMPRKQLIFGIAAFLVIMLSGAFCLIGKLMGPAKDSTQGEARKKSRAESRASGEKSVPHYNSGLKNVEVDRKQHIHDGRVIYEWGQTTEVAMLYTKVPEGVTKDDLEIMITPSRVQVGRKGKPPFISEETHLAIDDEGSYWRLCTNGELQLRLQKESSATWPSLLVGHEDD